METDTMRSFQVFLAGITVGAGGLAVAQSFDAVPAVMNIIGRLPLGVEVAAVRFEVQGRLRDPNAAQFRKERVVRRLASLVTVCGEVNARNAFGAYVGFRPYMAWYQNGTVTIDAMANTDDESVKIWAKCVSEAARPSE